MFKLVFVVVLIAQVVHSRDYYDEYTNRNIYLDFFGQTYDDDRYLVDSVSSHKDNILKIHNQLRNRLALGQIRRFEPAARMPALRWSEDLARLSKSDVRSCAAGNGACYSSEKLRDGGRNVARRTVSTSYDESPSSAVTAMIMDWFLEYRDCDMSFINSYHDHPQGYERKMRDTSDFAVMANDRYTAVGCALTRNEEYGTKYYHLVCNYGYTDSNRRPIYESGSAASKCRQQHPVYEGLCSSNQPAYNRLYRFFF